MCGFCCCSEVQMKGFSRQETWSRRNRFMGERLWWVLQGLEGPGEGQGCLRENWEVGKENRSPSLQFRVDNNGLIWGYRMGCSWLPRLCLPTSCPTKCKKVECVPERTLPSEVCHLTCCLELISWKDGKFPNIPWAASSTFDVNRKCTKMITWSFMMVQCSME